MWYTRAQLVPLRLGMPNHTVELEGDNINNFVLNRKRGASTRPNLSIFGCLPVNLIKQIMVIFCLLEAKHKIAPSWKSMNRSGKHSWVDGLVNCLAMEKRRCILKGNTTLFIGFGSGRSGIRAKTR